MHVCQVYKVRDKFMRYIINAAEIHRIKLWHTAKHLEKNDAVAKPLYHFVLHRFFTRCAYAAIVQVLQKKEQVKLVG